MSRRDMCWTLAFWVSLVAVALVATVVLGCAAAGKQSGAVPVNIEAPDTATADHGSAASTGWFTLQSTGGSIGVAVVSVAALAVMAWALTQMYQRFVCRYPQTCERGGSK